MSGRDVKPRLPRMPGAGARTGTRKAALVAAAESQPDSAAAPAAPEAGPSTATATATSASSAGAADSGSHTDAAGVAGQSAADGTPVATASADAMDVDVAETKPVVSAPALAATTLSRSTTAGSEGSGTATPGAPTPAAAGPSGTPASASGTGTAPRAATPSSGPPKMKFKPKMPVRRAAQEDVKPSLGELASAGAGGSQAARRPTMRGRGRGGAAGRGGRPQVAANTIAAGPFGGTRQNNSSRRFVAPPAPPRYQPDMTNVEVYSDNEDGTRAGVIDMEAVSTLSESAPTSVYRDRDLDGGKAKAKELSKARLKELKNKRKAERQARTTAALAVAAGAGAPAGVSGAELLTRVKAEPLSPLASTAGLPDPNAGVPPPLERVGDEMIPADEQQDRDEAGRRVRALTSGATGLSTPESEEVNAAHAIDLSASESEDEEEDMEGDFVFVPGNDNPEDKLFTFQFPANMPRFAAPAPPPDPEATAGGDGDGDGDVVMTGARPSATAATADVKPDIKPTAAQLRKRRQSAAGAPPPEGRIGTLCVMKSGKVKLVMGEGANAIVMNVAPGVPTTFLQQLVHVDGRTKSTVVLGEVHKQYTATPDLDRLLEELFLNGGETPGDHERRVEAAERRSRIERGLVKMEMSSP